MTTTAKRTRQRTAARTERNQPHQVQHLRRERSYSDGEWVAITDVDSGEDYVFAGLDDALEFLGDVPTFVRDSYGSEWHGLYRVVRIADGCVVHEAAIGGGSEDHAEDIDCTLDPATLTCTGCGVVHGDACPACGGRGFHRYDCDAVTDEQIEALSREAGKAGDLEQVRICASALKGNQRDRQECARVIREARA